MSSAYKADDQDPVYTYDSAPFRRRCEDSDGMVSETDASFTKSGKYGGETWICATHLTERLKRYKQAQTEAGDQTEGKTSERAKKFKEVVLGWKETDGTTIICSSAN